MLRLQGPEGFGQVDGFGGWALRLSFGLRVEGLRVRALVLRVWGTGCLD